MGVTKCNLYLGSLLAEGLGRVKKLNSYREGDFMMILLFDDLRVSFGVSGQNIFSIFLIIFKYSNIKHRINIYMRINKFWCKLVGMILARHSAKLLFQTAYKGGEP